MAMEEENKISNAERLNSVTAKTKYFALENTPSLCDNVSPYILRICNNSIIGLLEID